VRDVQVMQHRRLDGRVASHSETAADDDDGERTTSNNPPVNRERKGQMRQTRFSGVCCFAAQRSCVRMTHPNPLRTLPARSPRGIGSACAAAHEPALRRQGHRDVSRGQWLGRHVSRLRRLAACRPAVVTIADAANPSDPGQFSSSGF
jgi:hypothetical protein